MMSESEDARNVKGGLIPCIRIGKHFELHPVVFPTETVVILALVVVCFSFSGADLESSFSKLQAWIGGQFGWLYVLLMSTFLILCVWLATGKTGSIRLGRDDERPEFGQLSWFTMLFSAGMGIGLLFFGVAEPIMHLQSTPPGFADGLNESRLAMAVTIFHWGLHPWALYAVVGLALAYFGFRRQMPLSFRSMLHPLFGDRIWGRTGDVVDIFVILSTLIGVATSLGLGAQQVNAGLSFLTGLPLSSTVQVWLIVGITAIATCSVVLGLDAGIRRLSEFNMMLAGILMVIVIFGGGLVAFLGATVENTGAYFQVLPFNALRTGAFSDQAQSWLNSWTVFYWAWWISWSPFVGMFIARISKGRTIREFIVGVLLVPTAVAIIWLTAFGTTTLQQHQIHQEQIANNENYIPADELPTFWVGEKQADQTLLKNEDGLYVRHEEALTAVQFLNKPIVTEDGTSKISTTPTVLFSLLAGLMPWGWLVNLSAVIATLCIVLFFVTSSDSASMVVDIIASGGNPDPPVGTRLFWAITEGLIAAALLMAGGLKALQAASITAALPLTLILIMGIYTLVQCLRREVRMEPEQEFAESDLNTDSH
jgi:choline/glycine/proline betaine transport protein